MKIQRLIAIITILLQVERISAVSLAEKFEVSIRTIYRDIEAIEQAGIPIVSHTGITGGFSIVDGYKIDKKLFTNKDISNLLSGLNLVASGVPKSELSSTLEKIKALIPQESYREIQLSSSQIYIDMTPWANNPMLTNNLEMIKRAMHDNSVLEIEYTGREKTTAKRIIEPHQLVLKENTWYLRAFCRNKNEFRIFKLNRISGMEFCSEKFERKEFESKMTDFKDWRSDKLITVDVRMPSEYKERALDYVREENIEDTADNKILVHMPFVESELGYNLLLGFGPRSEVVVPEHVRQKLISMIKELSKIYE